MVRVFFFVVYIVFTIYTLYHLIQIDKVKYLNKFLWFFLIVFLPFIGALLFWIVEKEVI